MKKRMLALLAVLCCVALVAALFVACNNGEEGQTDNNTGVTTPADDDAQQGAETPDDEQGGETTDPDDEQGGDTQDPADPDEGEEDPDEDIEEPETPDEDIDEPIIPEEKEPTTISELLSADESYQQEALNALMKVSLSNILYCATFNAAGKEPSTDITKIENLKVDISNNIGDTINKFKVYFTFDLSDKANYYFIMNVEPKGEVSLSDLFALKDDTNGEILNALESKFKLERGGASFTREYVFQYNPSIQESSAALTEALKNVAIKDGDLEIEIDESAEFYIKDRGSSIDTILKSEVRYMELFVKTDFGYQQIGYSVAMVNPSWNIETLVKQVESGKYRSYFLSNGKGEFTGHIIDVADNGDADAVGE